MKVVPVVAGVICWNGCILIHQRTNPNKLIGKWECPGGKIELNETPEQALIREIWEELDLETTVVEVHKAEHENETEEEKKKRLEEVKKAEEDAERAKEKKKTEMIKSAFPGVLEAAQKVVVEPLQTEIKKAQDDLTEMRGKLQRDEMRIFARDMTPGDDEPSDEKVDELITIRKSMDDKGWKAYTESQRGLVTQIEKSSLFERQTNPAGSTAGSAYEKLTEIVKSVIEKSENKDQSKAWDHVISTNPVLYEQYRTEQAAQAKVGSAS